MTSSVSQCRVAQFALGRVETAPHIQHDRLTLFSTVTAGFHSFGSSLATDPLVAVLIAAM